MRNIRLVIAYDGTAYSGWQIQPNVPTVQGVIEDRLQQMTWHPCRLRVVGRTDAGVHALGQVANFRTDSSIPDRGFFCGLNTMLPGDISIVSAVEVPLDFDARRHNNGKHYRYTIWNQRSPAPLLARTAFHIFRPLAVEAMVRAARYLVGRHDFASFQAAECDRETTVRTLYRCTVSQEGALIHIDVEGTAFLKNMVRIIAGTLVEVGQNHLRPEFMPELLRRADRREAGLTAPPHGLCLMKVFLSYPELGTGLGSKAIIDDV
jgi:tRNA pseudouridine38-40 synthase